MPTPASRLIDAKGNITQRVESFGYRANLSPSAERERAAHGTKAFPPSFIFDGRALPPDFFTALAASPFHVGPDPRECLGPPVATGAAIATDVISALLYYAQFYVNPRARYRVLYNLRLSGKHEGDLLDALVEVVNQSRGRDEMRGYSPKLECVGDPMWEAGEYYTANGIGKLTAQAAQAMRGRR